MTCKYGVEEFEKCGLLKYGSCKSCYDMNTLMMGTKFYVINGDWNGEINCLEWDKCIHMDETNQNYVLNESRYMLLRLKYPKPEKENITIEDEDDYFPY